MLWWTLLLLHFSVAFIFLSLYVSIYDSNLYFEKTQDTRKIVFESKWIFLETSQNGWKVLCPLWGSNLTPPHSGQAPQLPDHKANCSVIDHLSKWFNSSCWPLLLSFCVGEDSLKFLQCSQDVFVLKIDEYSLEHLRMTEKFCALCRYQTQCPHTLGKCTNCQTTEAAVQSFDHLSKWFNSSWQPLLPSFCAGEDPLKFLQCSQDVFIFKINEYS